MSFFSRGKKEKVFDSKRARWGALPQQWKGNNLQAKAS